MCEALEKDLYAVLGAQPTDSALQLKHRYQQLALQVNAEHTLTLYLTIRSYLHVFKHFCLMSEYNNFITCTRVCTAVKFCHPSWKICWGMIDKERRNRNNIFFFSFLSQKCALCLLFKYSILLNTEIQVLILYSFCNDSDVGALLDPSPSF